MKTARVALAPLGLALLFAACAGPSSGMPTGVAGTTGTAETISCSTGQTVCGQECVDTEADAKNCGDCGIPCSTGQICQNGTCACQSGMLCNGACVSSDANHCGNCTTSCPANQVCSDDACSASCAGGQTLCGTACVVTNGSDVLNCGHCGTTCPAGQTCNAGSCGCSSGQAMCDSSCVDTATSNANCGTCGHACGSHAALRERRLRRRFDAPPGRSRLVPPVGISALGKMASFGQFLPCEGRSCVNVRLARASTGRQDNTERN